MSETPAEQLPVSESILASTKKILGIDDGYEAFDLDVIMHINSTFSTLHDLGIGPENGLAISDRSTPWAALLLDQVQLNAVQTYVYLKVRLAFDPPQTSFHINAIQEQVKELEWRISVRREGVSWVEPVRTSTINEPVEPIW